jgi:FAD/FMN-containing dehydrogenase/Fe-S oxidoreductase
VFWRNIPDFGLSFVFYQEEGVLALSPVAGIMIHEQQRQDLARHLKKHIAGEVRFDVASRHLYSTDASIYQIEPLGVVIPRTAEDIAVTVQVCGEVGVPITARGGGTSLSGQSIGPGIVLDCSKHLANILDLDPVARTVRIQPGVVLDQLNKVAAEHGLLFGPDVSTASRANLGGMIGNNSAGSHSIVCGKTLDHVRSLNVVLADGTRAHFAPLAPAEWEQKAAGRGVEAGLYRRVREVVIQNRDEIRRRFPRILRRVSGYNLDALCSVLASEPVGLPHRGEPVGCPPHPSATAVVPGKVGLHQLLVGSEGTLGVTTEAELGLLPLPKARGLLVPQFASLGDAMNAVAPCLEAQPSAIELLDQMLIELCAANFALRDAMRAIQGSPHAILMVEFTGDEPAEVQDQVERLRKRLQGVPGLIAAVPAVEPALRDPLWNLRRASMPLLYGLKGDRKPITFVEDAAVAPAHLPEYVARFKEILHRHGTDGCFYGHASVGCLHIRPLINLKDGEQVSTMHRIAEEVADLVLQYGGSLSGEHGDGLVRSEFNEKMFGPAIYRAFCTVKDTFDPRGVLNPGRVVRAPRMTENLRYPPGYAPVELPTVFDYSSQEGFVRSVEMCNGNGACRKLQGGTMCPSYRATLDERDSTRGRANALRHVLAGAEPAKEIQARWPYEVLDLCLMCKACKSECPSAVDMAKLKAEYLQLYYDKHRRPLGQFLMSFLPQLNRFAAPFAPLVNWVQSRGVVRWLMEKLAGIDRRRSLPPVYFGHFRRWFRKHRPDPLAGTRGRVFLLDDCFTTYNEPGVGKATVRLLERAGYAVKLLNICCGRVLISKGFLRRARGLVQAQAAALAQKVADGTPILGVEPSCLLSLADEWTELLPGLETRQIAAASHLADAWLAEKCSAGECELPLTARPGACVLHGHCHQKALVGTTGSAAALKLVPGLDVKVLDTGCCGMAGSFGYEAEHYDLSVKIAGLSLLPALEGAPEATVAAPGTSCRHQIKDLAHRRALHPLEVLAEQLPAG